MRVVQPCTEKSPLDRGDEQHQLAASQAGPAPRWPMLLGEHFQAHPMRARQQIEKAATSYDADMPQLRLSIKVLARHHQRLDLLSQLDRLSDLSLNKTTHQSEQLLL